MVFGSSVNPLDTDYKSAASPYEASLANVSALHARGFECSTPASPSRNSDSHAAPAPLITATHQHERAASPSPSSDSAGGAAATPPADRPALGRFSASFPQFASHSMSPLDPVTASATYSDGIRGPAAGFTTMPPSYEQHAPNSEQLMVTVHPEDLQPPADSAAAVTAALDAAPAAAAPPLRRAIGFEEEGALGPSLPPLAPPAPAATATHPQHCYPSHATSRPRHGSATTISYGPAGYPPPSPGDAAASPLQGMSPSGSLSEHITRAASLPLLMCNAVLPPGASPAIPIAIAGVGSSGRARATTVHTPLTVSGGGAGASIGGSAGTAGTAAGVVCGHRGVTQSVDHHFMQRHIAAQAQQQQFYHQSDGGGGAVSSPVHFVGSVSPSATTASFHTAFPGPPSGPGTLSGEEVGQPPSADRRSDILATAAGPAAAAAAAAAAACRGGEVEIELDLMERESSLTSGTREPRVPQLAEVGLVGAPPVVAAGAGAAAVATTSRDTDGDEEFQDAVEVQHDDDDHVSFHDHMVLGGRSPAGARPPHGGGGGGGAHFHAHNHHHHHQHRLQRCNYAVGETYSPEALSRQPTGVSSGGDAQVHQIHVLQEQQQELQQHSAPLPVAAVGGVVVYRHEYEEESGDHILEDGSYPRRHGRIVTAAEDDEEDDEGGAADLEEDEDDVYDREEEVFDEDEDDEVLGGDEDLAFGGSGRAGGGGFAAAVQPQYVTPAVPLKPHICVNCTRPFYGATCRCGHPADAEVVVSELLEGAVQSMLAGEAAAAASTHQQQQPHGPVGHGAGVLLAYDDRCRAHLEEASPGMSPDQGRSHPERPERVAAIMARLQATGLLARFARTVGREATLPELVAVHDAELVSELEARTAEVARVAQQRAAARAAAAGGDAAAAAGQDSDMGDEWLVMQRSAHVLDCYFNASTAGCARLAAGSAAEVARRVVSGAARHGAAIIRPPGHHAESSVAMGFCYYNNAAVAARAAQAAGAARVLIMDWDVHHGNGTQRIFYDDPSVLYMSTHRYDGGNFYPGTGDAGETGSGPGVGFTVNVPWNRPGVRDADMLAAFRHVIVPLATEFRPDLVIVSAGFDAAEGDPLGGCLVSTAAFSHFAALLSGLAPTVLLLEGGYNLTATAAATEACLRVLLGEPPAPLPEGLLRAGPAVGPLAADPTADPWVATGLEGVSESALDSVRLALRVQSQFWLSARENLVAVEAAIEERRHRQLMRLQQQQPLQPREQWGWHVQMPAASPMLQPQQPAPVAAAAASPPPAVVQLAGAAGEFHGGSPPSPAVAAAAVVVAAEHFLEGPEMEAVETRRRMDVSSSGVMDLGEQGVLGGGGTDVHMG